MNIIRICGSKFENTVESTSMRRTRRVTLLLTTVAKCETAVLLELRQGLLHDSRDLLCIFFPPSEKT